MAVYCCVLGLLLLNCGICEVKKKSETAKKVCFFLSAVILLFVAGFRYMVGTDYQTYMEEYSAYKTENIDIFQQPALNIIARISSIIYDDYATWFFIMAAITIVFFMLGIYKHSISIWISVLLFLFLGCWHETFNGVKQSVAVAILFFAYDNIKAKRFWRWTIYCIIASFFHFSALIMIPVYFLVKQGSICWSRCFLIVMVGVILFLMKDYLFDLSAFLKHGENTTAGDSDAGMRTVKWQRVAVALAPILFFLIFKKFYNCNDEDFSILFYFSLLNAVLYLFCSSSVYLLRICMFTNIFNVLFIPYLIKPFKKKDRAIILGLILILYFIFWIYDLTKVPELKNFYWIWER